MRTSVIAAAAAAAFIGTGAQAQLFKCKGPDGKIVYSDTRCESGATTGALPAGVSNRAHENEAKAAADKAAAEKAEAERKANAKALVEAAKEAGMVVPGQAPAARPVAGQSAVPAAPMAYEPTSAEQDRLRSLEIDMRRSGASAEQKRAAQMEASSIRSGREARMSSADKSRRDGLNSDLVSTDAKKRKEALQQLESIYYR